MRVIHLLNNNTREPLCEAELVRGETTVCGEGAVTSANCGACLGHALQSAAAIMDRAHAARDAVVARLSELGL